MNSILFENARTIARRIQTRELSAVEVLEAHLAQIERQNPQLNAVVTLDSEGARRQAALADAALARGEVWGPLHGLPLTLKDGHSTAGMRTTIGFPGMAQHVPTADGAVAARLKASGAVIMGKTNVSMLMGDIQSNNPVFGRTNNPWDLTRTPGGSSGGAAAAVAAGLTPLEVGSDLGGSTRLPAHFAGIYAFKPTEGRVSNDGLLCGPIGAPRTMRSMLAIGPMARSVEDLDLAFRILAAPGNADLAPVPLQEPGRPELRQLRVAWAPTFPGTPVLPAIAAAVAGFASRVAGEGARVEESLPTLDWTAQSATFRQLLTNQVMAALPPGAHGPNAAPPASLAEHFIALDRRDQFTRAWDQFFGEWDVLITPVSPTTAFAHCAPMTPFTVNGESLGYLQQLDLLTPFNLSGHPAVVLPLGLDEAGLPFGLQVVGRRWDDERLLAIAAELARLTGWVGRPAGF